MSWTVILGLSLPPEYDVGHWNLAWIGLDTGLLCIRGYAARAARFRRRILASTAFIAGTLLPCDASFGIITSIGRCDQWPTLLTGFGGDLPLAVFFFWPYRRIDPNNLAAFHQYPGDGSASRQLRETQILRRSSWPPAETQNRDPVTPPLHDHLDSH